MKWYLIGFIDLATNKLEYAELFTSRVLTVMPHRGKYAVCISEIAEEYSAGIALMKSWKEYNHPVYNKWIELFNKYPCRHEEEKI